MKLLLFVIAILQSIFSHEVIAQQHRVLMSSFIKGSESLNSRNFIPQGIHSQDKVSSIPTKSFTQAPKSSGIDSKKSVIDTKLPQNADSTPFSAAGAAQVESCIPNGKPCSGGGGCCSGNVCTLVPGEAVLCLATPVVQEQLINVEKETALGGAQIESCIPTGTACPSGGGCCSGEVCTSLIPNGAPLCLNIPLLEQKKLLATKETSIVTSTVKAAASTASVSEESCIPSGQSCSPGGSACCGSDFCEGPTDDVTLWKCLPRLVSNKSEQALLPEDILSTVESRVLKIDDSNT